MTPARRGVQLRLDTRFGALKLRNCLAYTRGDDDDDDESRPFRLFVLLRRIPGCV